MEQPAIPRVYKILSPPDRQVADRLGHTQTALDTADGYVHLSTRQQVGETLALHYKGTDGVHLLEYEQARLDADLRWEESRGGQLFPHLYAALRPAEARRSWVLEIDASGVPQLPDDIDA